MLIVLSVNGTEVPTPAHYGAALGAVGITAARVVEVTRMAEAGIPSILLAHICVDEAERRQLAAAARRTQLLLCADHFVQLERYSQTAVEAGVTFEVLVDGNSLISATNGNYTSGGVGFRQYQSTATYDWIYACE